MKLRHFEAFTVVMFKVEVFWVVMPCSVMVGYQHFRGPCCLHVQGEVAGMGGNSIDISLHHFTLKDRVIVDILNIGILQH
jgi:hypothetical protein